MIRDIHSVTIHFVRWDVLELEAAHEEDGSVSPAIVGVGRDAVDDKSLWWLLRIKLGGRICSG